MTTPLAPPVQIGKAAVGALGLLALATGVLESVVSPTLPLLQQELSISRAEGALLSIALLITGAIFAPIAGNLGDRHGGKWVITRLMMVVCAGGLVSAMAPNLPVMLLGQVLQGAMVGAMPLSFILVRKYLPAGESGVAIGMVSGLFLAGGMLGTLIAGFIAETLSRHWMFAIPTFAIIVATLLVYKLMPNDPPARIGAKMDWPGLVLLSAILLTLMFIFSMVAEVGSQPLVFGGVLVLLAALVAGWVSVERRSAAPMVDLQMLAKPAIWSSYVITFAICLGTSASMYLVPQLFELPAEAYGFGASATDIGRYLLPGAIAAAIAGPLSGLLARRFGASAVVAAGIGFLSATLIGMAFIHTEVWHLVIGKVLVALASGICVTAMIVKTAASVDHSDTGTATSLVLVIRVIAYAAGAQIGGAFLTAATPAGSNIPAESAFTTVFVITGVVTALSLLAVRTLNKGAKE